MQEQGKWEPVNSQAIIQNVGVVLKKRDIGKLNMPTYKFLISKMSFIAHYGLFEFQDEYRDDVGKFVRCLLTSEYTMDKEYNRDQAKRQLDSDFIKWYGKPYCHSCKHTMLGIIEAAEQYLN